MSNGEHEAVRSYLDEVRSQHQSGQAREHAYRPALDRLVSSFPDTKATNDPKRSEHGHPDFVFLKDSNKEIILGYAEAKDVTVDLDKIEQSDQMRRYAGYDNLILTNYLEFRFYKNGDKHQTVRIGELENDDITPLPDNFSQLEAELQDFLERTPEQIKSGKRLAVIMGGKALRIRENIRQYLEHEDDERNQELENIYELMRQFLVHDLTTDDFADMYAQTLVYGLFVARYNDPNPDTFSRAEARDLVPKSNPFLQQFFDHIVGPDFDRRLSIIVDELCDVFRVSDVKGLVNKHLRLADDQDSGDKDPIIHFYEDFLKEYDPVQRKKMGAYYTPVPVVNFIVWNVDRILKDEFGLSQGLADTSKITREINLGQEVETIKTLSNGKDIKTTTTTKNEEFHRVQILDPAVGTATFLNETIKYIRQRFEGQKGRWPGYVESDLLPRLHGFELMMAPYTIAHLKLGLTLQQTGVEDISQRLGVYLTNSLEEGIPRQTDMFQFDLVKAVSEEARQAAEVKSDRPIMVVMGNPPYSGESSNKTEYANSLVDKYKFEPGGWQKLQERNPKWLNDDYVKFIAFAEDMIERNGEGVVAMITNHGYLDNPTFRGMRWHLAKTFDQIYILDLHGNAKKKETAPDGSKDENVFDIQQGVAVIIGVKNGQQSDDKLAKVYHADIYGTRSDKFDALSGDVDWQQLNLDEKMLYFTAWDIEAKAEYDEFIPVNELFPLNSVGVVTARDGTTVQSDKASVSKIVEDFKQLGDEELRDKYDLGGDVRDWSVRWAKEDILNNPGEIIPFSYRPFDTRYTYYTGNSRGFHCYPRSNVMKEFMTNENYGICLCRQIISNQWSHIAIADKIVDDSMISNRSRERGYVMPLYLYKDEKLKR